MSRPVIMLDWADVVYRIIARHGKRMIFVGQVGVLVLMWISLVDRTGMSRRRLTTCPLHRSVCKDITKGLAVHNALLFSRVGSFVFRSNTLCITICVDTHATSAFLICQSVAGREDASMELFVLGHKSSTRNMRARALSL